MKHEYLKSTTEECVGAVLCGGVHAQVGHLRGHWQCGLGLTWPQLVTAPPRERRPVQSQDTVRGGSLLAEGRAPGAGEEAPSPALQILTDLGSGSGPRPTTAPETQFPRCEVTGAVRTEKCPRASWQRKSAARASITVRCLTSAFPAADGAAQGKGRT